MRKPCRCVSLESWATGRGALTLLFFLLPAPPPHRAPQRHARPLLRLAVRRGERGLQMSGVRPGIPAPGPGARPHARGASLRVGHDRLETQRRQPDPGLRLVGGSRQRRRRGGVEAGAVPRVPAKVRFLPGPAAARTLTHGGAALRMQLLRPRVRLEAFAEPTHADPRRGGVTRAAHVDTRRH